MCREYDLILAMEQNHIEAVTRGNGSPGKTFLFGYWLQQMEILILIVGVEISQVLFFNNFFRCRRMGQGFPAG